MSSYNSTNSTATIFSEIPSTTTALSIISRDPTYYDIFQQSGHTTVMMVIIWMKASVGTVGLILNGILVLLTIYSSTLHKLCHWLIAIDSLCLAIFQLNNLATWVILVSGIKFVPLYVCFFIQLLPQLGITIEYGVMLLVGMERVLRILFPFWKGAIKYVYALLLTIWTLLCCTLLTVAYTENIGLKNMVFCQLSDVSSRPGPSNSISSMRTLVCRCTLVCIYALLFLLVKFGNKKESLQNYQKDIFKAVMLIMLVEIVFWVPGTVLNKFYLFFELTNIQKTYISAYISTLSLIGSCLNAPILFAISKGYREAMSYLLNKFMKNQPSKASSNKINCQTITVTAAKTTQIGYK